MDKKIKEISAGGLVFRNKKILMVKVKNLEGKILWTFPKGHIEKGETTLDAALREVLEETGWKCEAVQSPFHKVHYQFQRHGKRINKTVVWYLMRAIKKKGEKDPEEILSVRWFSLARGMRYPRAKKIAIYPSDKKLLKMITAIPKRWQR